MKVLFVPTDPKVSVQLSQSSVKNLRDLRDKLGVSLDETLTYLIGLSKETPPPKDRKHVLEADEQLYPVPGHALLTVGFANPDFHTLLGYDLIQSAKMTKEDVELLLDLLAWMFTDRWLMTRALSRRKNRAPKPPRKKPVFSEETRAEIAARMKNRVWTPEMRANLSEKIRAGHAKSKARKMEVPIIAELPSR